MTEQENTEVEKAVTAGVKAYRKNAEKAAAPSFMMMTFEDDGEPNLREVGVSSLHEQFLQIFG